MTAQMAECVSGAVESGLTPSLVNAKLVFTASLLDDQH